MAYYRHGLVGFENHYIAFNYKIFVFYIFYDIQPKYTLNVLKLFLFRKALRSQRR